MGVEEGVRVIRGPHWQGGEVDGGEGHLGTIKTLLSNGQVRVLWDNGQEVTCQAGADGKYELRVLDTAPVGVCHRGRQCAGCGETDFYGMLWRCLNPTCHDVTLCPLCYVMDKHDVKHPFERVDYEGAAGEPVKKRSVSLRIRTMGIFPGAKVKRGRDWIWGNQDGGAGCLGDVIGFENVAPTSSRNLVRVKWNSGTSNSYRLGLQGCVDIECVDEMPGTYYYRDHLPLVDTTSTRTRSTAQAPSTSAKTSSPASLPGSEPQSSPASSSKGVDRGESGELRVGDKVSIAVGEEKLKQLQANYGGATAGMVACIGKSGELMSVTANGAVQVKFKRLSYRFNPQVLLKVPDLCVGETVQILRNMEQAKVINKRVGWKPEMDVTCGKVGRVVKIDEDGDVAVAFGRRVHLYAPACCSKAPGLEPHVLSASSSVDDGSSRGAQGDSGDNEQELHKKMMKMLAQMVQEERSGSSGQDQDGSEMGQLFKAITRGDVEAVRNVCIVDPPLMRKVHRGMTLLMVACHEAQRDIINALLDLGAPIDGQGERGNTALGAALEGKKESIALYLMERGADIHQQNDKGRSAAHLAAYNNMGEALTRIIKQGANINLTDNYGDAPLHDAIEKDNKEAIDVLMEAPGLNMQQRNKKGFNMLQLACLRGNAYAVEKLLQRDRAHMDDLMQGEFNALQIAVTNDHVECARLLIVEGKASLDIQGSQGLTALHLACNEAYPRSVELLINYGADLALKAEDGNTALHLALGTKSTQLEKDPSEALEKREHRSRVRIACMLLEKGACVDVTNNKGAQPLQCCRSDVVKQEVAKFIANNPQLIKRKGGGGGARGREREVSPQQLQSAMNTLLSQIPDATKEHLQDQCKQS